MNKRTHLYSWDDLIYFVKTLEANLHVANSDMLEFHILSFVKVRTPQRTDLIPFLRFNANDMLVSTYLALLFKYFVAQC